MAQTRARSVEGDIFVEGKCTRFLHKISLEQTAVHLVFGAMSVLCLLRPTVPGCQVFTFGVVLPYCARYLLW
jgi:hypothetical protein